MSEQTQQQTANDELDVLRRTNSELVAKNTNRKQRISELEATVADLQGKLAERDTSLRAVTIDGPLKSMADSISNAPELWLEQFSKHYKVEMVNGELTLLSVDGKPVQKDGKPVPFETRALTELLTTGHDAAAKAFRAITIVSRASGGASTTQRTAPTAPKPATVKFGLR
jgi:hypothetical protein